MLWQVHNGVLNFTLDDVSFRYEMTKPFDSLAKGLLVLSNRDNKTAIELFLAGVRGWESGLQRRLDDAKQKQPDLTTAGNSFRLI